MGLLKPEPPTSPLINQPEVSNEPVATVETPSPTVPVRPVQPGAHVDDYERHESPWHDYCRMLLQRVDRWKPKDATTYVLGVTSCRPGAGVSSLVSHLGSTTASDTQRSVLIIDANLEDPILARLFSRHATPGLADVLLHGIPPEEAIQVTTLPNLHLLTAGSAVVSSVRAFSSINLPSILESVRAKYDLILVDLPPLEGSAAAACLAGLLDGIVLVVEAERDATEAAQFAQDALAQARAQLLGVVLNKRPR